VGAGEKAEAEQVDEGGAFVLDFNVQETFDWMEDGRVRSPGTARSLGPCSSGLPSVTCVWRFCVNLLLLYVADPSPVFVPSDLPALFPPFLRCSYTFTTIIRDGARGWSCAPSDGAFQRGFEADDQVLFTNASILIQHTVSAEINANIAFRRELGEHQSRHRDPRIFDPGGHTFRTRRCVDHMVLCSCRYQRRSSIQVTLYSPHSLQHI
jgi:hypothetical protein